MISPFTFTSTCSRISAETAAPSRQTKTAAVSDFFMYTLLYSGQFGQQTAHTGKDAARCARIFLRRLQDLFLGKTGRHLARGRARRPPARASALSGLDLGP